MTSREYDAAVIGLGGFGSAALYWLSKRLGDRVIGFERFELGHHNGASQDHSRIIRLSYHRPDYIRLARRAYQTWAEVEAESGAKVVTRTGGLDLFPVGAAIPEVDYRSSMTVEDVPFERLDAAETMRRWPQWRLEDGTVGLFQPDAGIADPNLGNAAHRRLATASGAEIREQTQVERLVDIGSGIRLELAGGESIVAGQVVIAADAWINELLASFDVQLPLTVTQEQVTYVGVPDPAVFAPERFPIWIWMDDPSFYGFPTYGEAGPKAAQDVGGREVTPATRTFDPDPDTSRRLDSFIARHLPGMVAPPILTRTCLYTLTPDRDFVVDRVPDHPGVVVLLGAAHGFKYASVLGRIAAELIVDGATPSAPELGAFRIDRDILRDQNPARSFLI